MADGPELSKDLLRGAGAIAEYLFGDRRMRRKVYHLAATSSNLPTFKLGSQLCALKSSLIESFKNQELRRNPGNK
jgi:hypothetical protein